MSDGKRANYEQAKADVRALGNWASPAECVMTAKSLALAADDEIERLRGHLEKTTGVALKLRARLNAVLQGQPDPYPEMDEPDEKVVTWGTLSRDKGGTPYRDNAWNRWVERTCNAARARLGR